MVRIAMFTFWLMLNCICICKCDVYVSLREWQQNMPSGTKRNKVGEDMVNYTERAEGII